MLLTSSGSKERYSRFVLQSGAFVVGVHRFSSGYYSPLKFVVEHLYTTPGWAKIVDPLFQVPFERVDALVAVSRGGTKIAQAIARRILRRQHRKIPVATTLKVGGNHTIAPEDAEHIAGLSVLVVDDVLTTGKNFIDTIRQATNAHASVVGCAVLFNRAIQGVPQQLAPYTIGYSLSWKDFPDYQEPLWQLYEYSWETPKAWFLARHCYDSTCQMIARFHDDPKEWTTISGSWSTTIIGEACHRKVDPLLIQP